MNVSPPSGRLGDGGTPIMEATMTARTYPPSKDRRNIGQVVFPIEKLLRARELSSCCVGVEAVMSADQGVDGFLTRETARELKRKTLDT
jgi:hypothetical protein